MYQIGDHFGKHGRSMGYYSKKEYDNAARTFVEKYQDHPDAQIYRGIWNGRGDFNGEWQRVITYDGKTAILHESTGQIVDFYVGTEYRGLIQLIKIR